VCCGCGGNHTASYRGRVKWKEAKASVTKQATKRSRKSVTTAQPAAPKAQRAGPSAEQKYLGEGWNHVVRGGVSSRPRRTHPTTHTLTPSHHATEAPSKPTVTATRETARPKKLTSNPQELLNGLLGSLRRKQPRVLKPRQLNPQHPPWWSSPKIPPPHSRISPIS